MKVVGLGLQLLFLASKWFITTAFTIDEIQIINNTEKLLDGLGDRVVQWGLNDVGSDYEVAAIMGSQSSGKSTLLNNLFQTNFTVMNPEVRGRTTDGVWLSRDHTHNIIVMDVEGADGASSKGNRNFERKSTLFALACSRLLIISMWENQVGLDQGANMGLLKIIFEEYLALFRDLDPHIYQRPRILFVIQAHSGGTNLTSLAQTITADLEAMWDSETKPPELMNQSLAGYFDFEFESTPHLLLAPDHYKLRVSSLRQRFVDQERGDYVFKRAHPNAIPADGLELYMTMAWEKIRLNENLNLPGHHELLARLVCDRISTSLLEAFRPKFASHLAILNEGKVVDGLGSLMQDWRLNILGRYDQAAGPYVQLVYLEKRGLLLHSFQNEVSKLFTAQLRNIRLSFLAGFGNILRDGMAKGDSEFAATVSNARDGYERDFIAAAETTATCIDATNLDWEFELEELRRGMEQLTKVYEQERKSKIPIRVSRTSSVGGDKSMTTTATLYRNGKLIVEVYTDCDDLWHGLWGRVLVVVRDGDGNESGATNVLHCTTRGGNLDPFTPSSGTDIFHLQFPEDVARTAVILDIYQADGGSFRGKLERILAGGKTILAVLIAVL